MQDNLINQVQDEIDDTKMRQKKRKASDFLKEDDSLHEAQLQILSAMQGKPMYRGSVDKETVRRRRLANKRARAARRKSRK